MRWGIIVIGCLAFLFPALPSMGGDWYSGLFMGLPRMEGVNGELAALAERQGGEVEPVRISRGGDIGYGLWGIVRLEVDYSFATGGVRWHEYLPVRCEAWELWADAGVDLPFGGWPFRLGVGIGLRWAMVDGALSGGNWDLTTRLWSGGDLIQIGPVRLSWEIGYRDPLAIHLRRSERGIPADFGGPYLGFAVHF